MNKRQGERRSYQWPDAKHGCGKAIPDGTYPVVWSRPSVRHVLSYLWVLCPACLRELRKHGLHSSYQASIVVGAFKCGDPVEISETHDARLDHQILPTEITVLTLTEECIEYEKRKGRACHKMNWRGLEDDRRRYRERRQTRASIDVIIRPEDQQWEGPDVKWPR